MKLIQFPEQTVVIAKDQPEYHPLPAHRFHGDTQGRIAFCWQMTWRERLKCLFTGKLWHQVLTFNQPLQPQLLGIEKPAMPLSNDLPNGMTFKAARKCAGIILAMLLCSCELPSEYLAISGPGGNMVRERRGGQIGGTRSSSRSDGSSEVNNYENSLRDAANAAGTAYGLKQVRIGKQSDNALTGLQTKEAAGVTKNASNNATKIKLGSQVPVKSTPPEVVQFPTQ